MYHLRPVHRSVTSVGLKISLGTEQTNRRLGHMISHAWQVYFSAVRILELVHHGSNSNHSIRLRDIVHDHIGLLIVDEVGPVRG